MTDPYKKETTKWRHFEMHAISQISWKLDGRLDVVVCTCQVELTDPDESSSERRVGLHEWANDKQKSECEEQREIHLTAEAWFVMIIAFCITYQPLMTLSEEWNYANHFERALVWY